MPTLIYIDEAVPYDLPTIYQGRSFSWQVALENPDGSAQDLTGMTFTAMARESVDGAAIFTFTCTWATNVVTMALTAAQTSVVKESKNLLWDFCQQDSLGSKLTLLVGGVNFRRPMTR